MFSLQTLPVQIQREKFGKRSRKTSGDPKESRQNLKFSQTILKNKPDNARPKLDITNSALRIVIVNKPFNLIM